MQLYDGIARRARSLQDPVIHILVGNQQMWCSGGEGMRLNSVSRKRCPACTALLRAGVADGQFDVEELNAWLNTTRSKRIYEEG